MERGDLGVMTGQGWYTFQDDQNRTIIERDRQLISLLEWLRETDAVSHLNVK